MVGTGHRTRRWRDVAKLRAAGKTDRPNTKERNVQVLQLGKQETKVEGDIPVRLFEL
ncbi:hypothetical protein BJ508DRAFT_419916 [Ascobolus immersus RN42]|uniref:Uncharacterized protein n=1 Tax=Ascobolus immersus RN42 TaxID=1160509 RepID=A0A3N4HDZ6_ASCIM|nr:hypothetical protein BJ508DRAFT_419916 [Ascobolus immersus RN42]